MAHKSFLVYSKDTNYEDFDLQHGNSHSQCMETNKNYDHDNIYKKIKIKKIGI